MNLSLKPHPIVSVIIPAHNESFGIDVTVTQVAAILELCVNTQWEIIVVDDGSVDETYKKICEFSKQDCRIKGLSLSRNFGKESALLAGLAYAQGSAVITLDADRQHPPIFIPDMVIKWQAGAEIVHAVKRNRIEDSRGHKIAAFLINRLVSTLGGININNSSDFKLLDRKVVDIIVHQLPENKRFFRGLISWVGFNEDYIYFDVAKRQGDESKWSFFSLVELSITALVSFTCAPLRMVTFLGFLTFILGLFVAGDAIISLINRHVVPGYYTIIICLLLIGSFIMISLGIIGEYIAKIYEEVKRRPHFLVANTVGMDN